MREEGRLVGAENLGVQDRLYGVAGTPSLFLRAEASASCVAAFKFLRVHSWPNASSER